MMFHEKNTGRNDVATWAAPDGSGWTIYHLRSWQLHFTLLALALAIGIYGLVLVVRVSATLLPANTDVFAPYQGVMPGQPTTALSPYTCQLYFITYSEQKFICVLSPVESPFHKVMIFAADGTISGIIFRINHLRVIDMIWRWGKPDQVYKVGGHYELAWKQSLEVVAQIGGRYSPQAPVDKIIISMAAEPQQPSDDRVDRAMSDGIPMRSSGG